MNSIRRRDYIQAEALSLGSSVAAALPDKLNFTAKTANETPSAITARWRHLRRPADTVHNWTSFEGTGQNEQLPRNFSLAAIIRVDRERMDGLLRRHRPARHAVVYRLGSTVMMGTSRHEILGLQNETEEEYTFAMGIGKNQLDVSVGVAYPITERSYTFQELTSGVRKGDIMPTAEVPHDVPFI